MRLGVVSDLALPAPSQFFEASVSNTKVLVISGNRSTGASINSCFSVANASSSSPCKRHILLSQLVLWLIDLRVTWYEPSIIGSKS